MCGIAALLAPEGRDLAPWIAAMSDLVAHRGPDGEGFVLFEGDQLEPHVAGGPSTADEIYHSGTPFAPAGLASSAPKRLWRAALGHRRLSIVELTAEGHQPMCDAERMRWVVYNGEIYNHVELREELRRLGHRFRSGSDTEVILAAYRQWGTDCLSHFNGMFAFVLLDRSTGTVFAARDRYGVKPLYFWRAPNGVLAFASEIKQFTVLPGWRAEVNRQRARDFLSSGLSNHTAETMFAGVRQLRGGEMLLARPGRPPEIRGWYELVPRPFSGGFEQAAEGFRELFEDAVRLRLRADVSVGSCLSGGLDSSSIVCAASELLKAAGAPHAQKVVSARARHAAFDEGRFMQAVVDKTGVTPYEVYPALEELDDDLLLRLAWHQDEPFGSTSIYAQWKVFELASRHGLKVMLDGQGADESLGGYAVFFSARLAGLASRLRLVAFLRELRAIRRDRPFPLMDFARHFVYSVLPANMLGPVRRLRAAAQPELRVLGAGLGPAAPDAPQGPRVGVHALSRAQICRTNLPMLLHWEDRNSMAHSVESRLPFLDYRLVEYVAGLPEEYLIYRGTTKRVLRGGMAGVLPDLVRDRKDKLGFATPEEVWVKREQPDLFRRWMRRAVEQSRGLLTDAAVDHLHDVIAGSQPFTFFPWRLISFGAWMERFEVDA